MSKIQISSAWVVFDLYLPQEHQKRFPILMLPSSKSDDFFLGSCLSCRTGTTHVQTLCFKKIYERSSGILLKHNVRTCSVADLLSQKSNIHLKVSLSSVPLFLSSEALLISSDFDTLMMKLVFSSKLFWFTWCFI